MSTFLLSMILSALVFSLGWSCGARSARKRIFRRNLKVYTGGLLKRDVQ